MSQNENKIGVQVRSEVRNTPKPNTSSKGPNTVPNNIPTPPSK